MLMAFLLGDFHKAGILASILEGGPLGICFRLLATLLSCCVSDTPLTYETWFVSHATVLGRTRTECATPSAALAATWPRRCWRSNHMTVRRRTCGRQVLSCLSCSRATPRSRWQSRRTGGSGPCQAGAMIASGLLIFEAAPTSRHLHR